MKRLSVLVTLLIFAFAGCSDGNPTGIAPDTAILTAAVPHASTTPNACWGQASKVFAQTGEMGLHSSQQPTPRLGLRNLARELYDLGVISDDTLQALGQFVAAELGLSIDACMP